MRLVYSGPRLTLNACRSDDVAWFLQPRGFNDSALRPPLPAAEDNMSFESFEHREPEILRGFGITQATSSRPLNGNLKRIRCRLRAGTLSGGIDLRKIRSELLRTVSKDGLEHFGNLTPKPF